MYLLDAFLAFYGLFEAIPRIRQALEDFAAGVALWYIQRATKQTLVKIADAAALGARAETQEQRYAALDAWQRALSRDRLHQ